MNFLKRIARNYKSIRTWNIISRIGAAVSALEAAIDGRDIEAAF